MRNVLLALMVATAFGMVAAPVNADGHSGVTVQGACYDHASPQNGAEDSAHVGTDGQSTPDQGNVQDGVTACANAAQNGNGPGPGSHLTVTVTVQGDSQSASTTQAPLP